MPIGPTTTYTRNIAFASQALLGLFCLVGPSLLGTPVSTRAFGWVAGAVLFAIVYVAARRWKPLLRRMDREAGRVNATPLFAYMQAQLTDGNLRKPRYEGAGWALLDDSLVTFVSQTAHNRAGAPLKHSIPLNGISEAALDATDAQYFNRLRIELVDGGVLLFNVVPGNGSALRGATATEIAAIASRLIPHESPS